MKESVIKKELDNAKNLGEMLEVCKMMIRSKLVRDELKTPEKVLMVLEYGQELGLSWQESLQQVAVIDDQIVLMGDAALSIVQRSGLLHSFKQEGNDRVCTVQVHRKGQPIPVQFTYTIEMAHQNGLNSVGWRKFPERMLYYRALSYALRTAFPDLLAGLHTKEEMEDGWAKHTIINDEKIVSNTLGAILNKKK